jgi:preprotein translocase subunit SecE
MTRQLRRSGALDTLASPQRKAPPRAALRPDFGDRGRGITQFLVAVWSELKRVVWPTRQEMIRLTIMVVGISVVLGVILGAIDAGFVKLFELLIQ